MYAITMQFDGFNNSAIQFKRLDQGADCGLGTRIAFEKALLAMLRTGLLRCSGELGSDEARYTLTLVRAPHVYNKRSKSALRQMRIQGNA